MKICFSTLACPNWRLDQVIELAARAGYEAIELRFLEGEDSLWKLPAFKGAALMTSKQLLTDHGLLVACVDTSCRFHSADRDERWREMEEGVRMAELAAELGAPGIRVFGDKIQPGTERGSTRGWIADGIRELSERTLRSGVEVWLETHGDFATSAEAISILEMSGRDAGVVWDPANALLDGGESPGDAPLEVLETKLRHVHLKDFVRDGSEWRPALTGEGDFPLRKVIASLQAANYERFVSFEWEKQWHPEIAEASIAVPHFAQWFRQFRAAA
jgi:sugar phosphate isomerase/epimerase